MSLNPVQVLKQGAEDERAETARLVGNLYIPHTKLVYVIIVFMYFCGIFYLTK